MSDELHSHSAMERILLATSWKEKMFYHRLVSGRKRLFIEIEHPMIGHGVDIEVGVKEDMIFGMNINTRIPRMIPKNEIERIN